MWRGGTLEHLGLQAPALLDRQSHTFISVLRVVEEGHLRFSSDWHPCTELVIPELAWGGKDMLCIAAVFSTHCLLYTFAFPLDKFSVDSCTRSSIYQCIFDLLGCTAGILNCLHHKWTESMAASCRRLSFVMMP